MLDVEGVGVQDNKAEVDMQTNSRTSPRTSNEAH